jgi:hypothetical protein
MKKDTDMSKKTLLAAALIAMTAPAMAFAYDGVLTFKAGCAVKNSGSCVIGVSDTTGSVKIYAASGPQANFGPVSNAFEAPGTKRIANSTNNVCFYAKAPGATTRTRMKCLAK